MMHRAKLRWPRRERSWLLVQHGARRKMEIRRLIQLTFLTGSEALNRFVSRVIPRDSRDVEGPSADSGTMRLEKTSE